MGPMQFFFVESETKTQLKRAKVLDVRFGLVQVEEMVNIQLRT
jgi:hypothetical protein